MHLWWNRSPIAASTALLYAALTDTAEDAPAHTAQQALLTGLAHGDTACLAQAQEQFANQDMPRVVDNFSGFGGLALAAEQLGLQTEASDLNSVAALLTKAAAEIPARVAHIPPVSRGAAFDQPALAEDIRYYGNWMLRQAEIVGANLYPKVNGSKPFAWLWVRTVECPNPACKCKMPLASSFVLSKRPGNAYWAELVQNGDEFAFRIHKGICPEGKATNKVGSAGAKFQCPACGDLATDDYVKKAGQQHRLGMQLMAVVGTDADKKVYFEPDAAQIHASEMPKPDDLPAGSISTNAHWFSPPGFGLTEYADLFTARQLEMLTAFCNLIPQVVDKVASDALAVGMSDSSGPLADGGNGALAYGQAVGTYLALAVSKMTTYHSTICTWNNQSEIARAAITRQAIPMTWTFAERNPFVGTMGCFSAIVDSIADSVACLPMQGSVHVTQQDAVHREYPKNAILFAELPYYDNVGYADMSDYFYIWLRKCLKPVYPELFEKIVTSKEELSSVAEHYGGDAAAAQAAYKTGLETLMQRFAPAASETYPSVLFFQYSKADQQMIFASAADGAAESRFANLLQSIVDAGFTITAVWPVRAEQASDRLESFRVAVVFRKSNNEVATIRRSLAAMLSREMPEKLEQLLTADVAEYDRPVIALGVGLSIATRYKKVLNADGSAMKVQDALQLAAQEATKFFAAIEENSEEN